MMAEVEPQLSPDLIKIMDERLSAIEHRNAILQRLINQVIQLARYCCYEASFFFFFINLC